MNWVSTDLEYYHDGNDTGVFLENHDSARSGVLSLEERSWMEARVQGEGTLTFQIKRSGDGDWYFAIDGQIQASGTVQPRYQLTRESYLAAGRRP